MNPGGWQVGFCCGVVRALDARERPGSVAGMQMGASMKTEGAGKSSVVIFLPDNGRSAPLDDDLRPEDLLRD